MAVPRVRGDGREQACGYAEAAKSVGDIGRRPPGCSTVSSDVVTTSISSSPTTMTSSVWWACPGFFEVIHGLSLVEADGGAHPTTSSADR